MHRVSSPSVLFFQKLSCERLDILTYSGVCSPLNTQEEIMYIYRNLIFKNIYIVDNHRIQRWLANGNDGTTLVGGSVGAASNELNFPEAIFLDKTGRIVVVDRFNNRIQAYPLIAC